MQTAAAYANKTSPKVSNEVSALSAKQASPFSLVPSKTSTHNYMMNQKGTLFKLILLNLNNNFLTHNS